MYNLCFQKSFKKLSMINLVNIWKNTLIGGGFLSMLLGTLGASLLGSILAGRGIKKNCRRSDSEETRSKNCKGRLWK